MVGGGWGIDNQRHPQFLFRARLQPGLLQALLRRGAMRATAAVVGNCICDLLLLAAAAYLHLHVLRVAIASAELVRGGGDVRDLIKLIIGSAFAEVA